MINRIMITEQEFEAARNLPNVIPKTHHDMGDFIEMLIVFEDDEISQVFNKEVTSHGTVFYKEN